MRETVLVFGGDKRQIMAAGLLKEKGYDVYTCGFENYAENINIKNVQPDDLPYADYILLPAPYRDPDGSIKTPYSARRTTLAELCSRINPNAFIVLGGEDEAAKSVFSDSGFEHYDLLTDDTYTVRNAFITAQAAVMICASKSLRALSDCNILICGYGRIGKMLTAVLSGYHCNLTVSARKSKDLEWIKAQGCHAVKTDDVHTLIHGQDFIINTVPFRIIGGRELVKAKEGAIFLELASKPYGIDFEEAGRLGIKTYIELGLPGRCFPYSAAIAVADAFQRIVQKRVV